MTNIVSSVLQSFVQKDGTKTICEVHTDIVGLTHQLVYSATANDDLNGALATHAANVGSDLDTGEVQTNIGNVVTLGSLASLTFIYSTAVENIAALRTAYQSATQIQAVMVADFLNTLTNAQLAVAFGITVGQAAVIRTNRLAPAAALATSIRATVGQ